MRSTDFGDINHLNECVEAYPSSPAYARLMQELDAIGLAARVSQQLLSTKRRATTPTAVGFGRQYLSLLVRQVRTSVINPLSYSFRLAVTVGIMLFSATVWLTLGTRDSAQIYGYIAYLCGVLQFAALVGLAAVPQRVIQRAEAINQRSNSMYSAAAYVLANFTVDLLLLFVFRCVLCALAPSGC